MKTKTLSQKEVLGLSEKIEGHFFDKKAKEISGKQIQKIAVALANADGGDFIIGIKDKSDEVDPNKRWDGANDLEYYNFVFQNILQTKPNIPNTTTFLFDEITKTYSLLVTIEKSEKVHSTSDGTVYIRVSAQSIPVTDPQKIQELSFAKGESSFEDLVYKEARAEDIFESNEMKTFLSEYSPQSDPVEFTVNQNLITKDTYEPKMAGLLLFNDNPVTLLPRKCGIKITRYDTSEQTPKRDHLKEQFTVEGSLYAQIHEATEIVTRLMSNVTVWTAQGMSTVEYPPETLWEIIVNAVIHRDYSISDDTHILIFNNRIEVRSPGKLPGYVTLDNILDARYSRNTKIVRTLNRYKNPPNKDMGEGLNTAFQKMKDWKLKPPVIDIEGNYVVVTIQHAPLATPEEAVMEFLSHNLLIKNKQARQVTGIESENVMKRVFYRLRDEGYIEPVMSKTGSTIIAWKKSSKN